MKKALIIIFSLFLLLPLVSSATTVTIKTLPGYNVFISIWNEDHTAQLQSPKKLVPGLDGIVNYTYDGTTSPFSVLVIVKFVDEQIYREEYGPYNVGGIVKLPNLLPEDYVDPLGQQTSQEEETTNQQENLSQQAESQEQNQTNTTNSTNITGKVISQEPSQLKMPNVDFNRLSKIAYYVLGGVFIIGILAAIIIFIISRARQMPPRQEYGMEPVKLHSSSKGYGDKDLDKIEKEISTVENEIVQYQKRTRLMDAEKRLEERRKQLEQIKRGGEHQTQLPHHTNHQKKDASRESRKEQPGYRKKVMGY